MTYLGTHNAVETLPLAPAQQGVMDELRARNL